MFQISEWLPNPKGNDRDGEWIEIVNTDTQPASLSGWSLCPHPDCRSDYVFSDIAVLPGSYLIIQREQFSFPLSNKDGQLFLYRPDATLADSLSFFGDAPVGKSYTRLGDSFAFTSGTPGFMNATAPLIPQAAQIHYGIVSTGTPFSSVLSAAFLCSILVTFCAIVLVHWHNGIHD
jgi:hypothetical protein